MRVLVACEESGRVRDAFRNLGHDAWSADLQPARTNPQWHLQGKVEDVLDDGWDLMIAFPPCMHLARSGARHWAVKQADGRQQAAIAFFLLLATAPIAKIAVENSVGIMSTIYRKPDQIVHPFYFGDPWRKETCLWLQGLPRLVPTTMVLDTEHMLGWNVGPWGPRGERRGRLRSITPPGLARAMADQWGGMA